MPQRYAILLDGGFVRRRLGSPTIPADVSAIGQFTRALATLPLLAGMRLHRIYFYDARPFDGCETAPLGGGVVNFGASAAAARSRSLQAALARQPFFALRFGDLSFEGWRLRRRALRTSSSTIEINAGDLEPNIRQKGVDMRIGLDIASLTLKRHVDVIVLVTADSDFVPAMKFARREGAQLVLVTLGHGIREALREHADLVIDEFPLPGAHP